MADAIFPEGKEQRDRASREANTDQLTGLANRRAFDLALPTAELEPDTLLVLFDANNFGRVNKVLGFPTGDEILKNMAGVLRLAASRYGVAARVFRLGGDEFVIICPAAVAEPLRDLAETLYHPYTLPDGTRVSVTGTVGRTLAEADSQMQVRKASKKNHSIH